MTNLVRLSRLALLFAWLAAGSSVHAGSLDNIYDDAEILPLRPRYERGWLDNVENVFRPVLTSEEQSRLAGLQLRIEPRVPGWEPIAFMAGGKTAIGSAASLKFLEDIAMAYTWLDLSGMSTQTVGDYLLMLRYWNQNGRPPKPWAAMCIPENAFDMEPFGERASRVFDSAAAFALLHEYGHIFYEHRGNRAVAPEESRANEEAADRFALDIFARLGEPPLGVTLLFFTMAHLQNEDGNATTATHPVSPARLRSFARQLTAASASYGRGFKADGRARAIAVALDVSQLALLLADPDIGELSARIGQTVTPQDLAPRAKGRHLAPPCNRKDGGQEPFQGAFHGAILRGANPLDVDVVLERTGDRVVGSYSFGAGFGRIEDGVINGSTLDYAWSLPPDRGRASVTLKDGLYQGSWGFGVSASGAGSIELRSER